MEDNINLHCYGSEPLAEIGRTDKPTPKELLDDMEALYTDIDKCIMALVSGRANKDDTAIANAQHKMESLMVRTQQEMRVIADYLTKKD